MVTIGPAWELRVEDKLGSIRIGKVADLAILERNIMFFEAPEELPKFQVLPAMVDGRFRHRDERTSNA